MRSTFAIIGSLLLGAIGMVASSSVTAQAYPTKPIRFIVPNTPSSGPDLIARLLQPELAKTLGQPIIVENRPGAEQRVASEYVAKLAPADGYTVMLTSINGLAILPATVKELRFDPIKDLPPVTFLASTRAILVSPQQVPWDNFEQMVAYIKANPGKINYGSNNLAIRLGLEAIRAKYGLDMVHVNYKGAASFLQSLVVNEIQLGATNDGNVRTHKLKPIAVTGEGRISKYPDVPSTVELGVPELASATYTINVRAGTPKAVVDRLHAAVWTVLKMPEIQAKLANIDMQVSPQDTPEAAVRQYSQISRAFSEAARKVNIQPE